MRTTLLLVGTLALLVGGFVLYWVAQSGDSSGAGGGTGGAGGPKPMAIRESESTYTVGGGKGVWLKQYDALGRLTNQFRADEYDPQKEGFVRVAKPEARFFMKGGQWIQVRGRSGDVYVSGLPEKSNGGGDNLFAPAGAGGSGPAGTPSRGRLKDVHISLFETPDAQTPSIDMEVDNAAFDNESFRIYTEAYTDADGKQIAADQVKVTVRGKYEFDGKGLTIRWNDRDQRLELLEIAHGERLVIKEPGAMRAKMPAKAPAAKVKQGAGAAPVVAASNDFASPWSSLPALVEPVNPLTALASADPAAAAQAVAAEEEASHYIIWLLDNVQVVQGEETIAVADSIEVHYAARNTPQHPQPTTAPAAQPAAPAQAAPEPAQAPAQPPATQPTADDAPQEPITIYWTGKLRITPSVSGPPVRLKPEQAAVQMRGSPVVLTRGNAVIRCPALTYRTSDGGATLHTSEAAPQVEIAQYATPARTGEPEMTLYSEWVEFAPQEGIATLGGKSRAEFVADESAAIAAAAGAEAAPPREMARVTWTREGIVRFAEKAAGGGDEESSIESLQLAGDVDVKHPQIALQSQKLRLAFAPPSPAEKVDPAANGARAETTRRPNVRQVIAEESVHCVLKGGSDVPRELTCEHLDLTTSLDPDGKLYPSLVKAHGKVRATEDGQELTAGDVEMTLAPISAEARAAAAKKVGEGGDKPAFSSGAIELQRMVARTDVRAASKDGTIATGTALVATSANGKTQVGLSGKPARVVDAQGNVLTSERIVIPSKDEAQALGAGTLRAALQAADGEAAAGETPRFMDVSWTQSAVLNGSLAEDQIQVTGDAKASMPQADGSVTTATARKILITVADKASAAADGAAPKPAKGKPLAKPAGDDDDDDTGGGALAAANLGMMKGKEVSRVVLARDAVIDSVLTGDDGGILQATRIQSTLLYVNLKTRRFIVPRPGTMLVRDHRPEDEAEPAAPDDTTAGSEPAGGADLFGKQRGATAFQWADSLDYDDAARRAIMKKDVIVAFRPDGDGKDQLPVRLSADTVVAEFEKPDAAAAKSKSPRDPLADAPALDLKSVTAEGNVKVVRGEEELTTPKLTFIPAQSTIVATGSESNRAVFSRAGRPDSFSATGFQWNTKTWDIKVIGAAARVSPQR